MNQKRLEEIIRTGQAKSLNEAMKAAYEIEMPYGYLDLDPSGERLVTWQSDPPAGVVPRLWLATRRFETAWYLATGKNPMEEIAPMREPGLSWREQLRQECADILCRS